MKLFIFGSTGDLVKRKVLPALEVASDDDLEIFAIGRRNISKEDYMDVSCGDKCGEDFKKKLHYLQVDFTKKAICSECLKFINKDEINYFYISMPPKFLDKPLSSLSKLKKHGIKLKILVEKPFGENLEHAKKLEKLIKENNLEKDIFLSDHYLFKENVVNLKRGNFKEIRIVVTEKLGLENRITYYDDVGALRDMVQSHFFNIVFKLVDNPEELMSAKVVNYIRAQYGNGTDSGYVEELGKKSATETFVFLKLRTADKEFVFMTGKAFTEKQAELIIDDEKFSLNSGQPYELIFRDFFSNKKLNFPTISNAILSWKIIEKIDAEKPKLKYYKKNSYPKEIIDDDSGVI